MLDSEVGPDAADGAAVATRRDALKKAATAAGVAGAAWAAPAISGTTLVPSYASAATCATTTYDSGVADYNLGCFSGAGGDDQFEMTLDDGYFHFYFQGCQLFNTVTIALADPAGGPTANAYEPPTGKQCYFELRNSSSGALMQRYPSSGYMDNPINGIADTGGFIIVGAGAPLGTYPASTNNVFIRVICDCI